MKKHALVAFTALAIAGGSLLAFTPAQSEKMDAAGLKRTLEGLGYEVKVIDETVDKETYEFKHTAAGFNIPIRASFSGSKNYLYFIASVAEVSKIESRPDIYKNLLAENAKIQPSFFFIGGNFVKIALVMENRGAQPADVKRNIELLGTNVGSSSPLWKPE